MISRRALVQTIATGALAAPFVGRRARAAGTVNVMVGGIEKIIYLPARLTQELGYYKDEGLDVELSSEPAGVEATDELVSGEVQGVVGFYDHCIDLQSKGKILASIVQFSRAPGEVVLVAKKWADKIKSPADWKGHGLGVTGLGSSTNFLMQYLAVEKGGLKLGDVTSVPVGAGNTFIAAMKQDHIQVGMTTEPTVSRLLSSGEAQILIDMRTESGTDQALGGTYPAACLYMNSAYVAKNRETTQKLARAYVKCLRFIANHSGEEIAAKMPKDYYAGDRAAYVKALDDGKAMFTADGVMPKGGPEQVLKVLAAFAPSMKGKTIDLSKTYTTEFVSKVA